MNNLIKSRLILLVVSLLIGLSLLVAITACSDELEGISNFYFADADNPAIIKVSFAYNETNKIEACNPLYIALSTCSNDFFNNILHIESFTTNVSNFILTGITNPRVYLIGWHDLNGDGKLSKSEPFGAYKNEYLLTNLASARVYGGATTNNLTFGISTNLLFGTGTLKVNFSYTGKAIKTTAGYLKAALFDETNFKSTALIDHVKFVDAKPKTYHFKGIESTNVYLIAWVSEENSNNIYKSGERVGIYANGNSSAKATAIGFLENVTMEKSLNFSFGDSYTDFQ